MIGLKRHTVRVVKHEVEWADVYEYEAFELRKHIGEIVDDIQHVGSTSVPDLPSKPILDIAVAVSSIEVIPTLIDKLTPLGYMDRGDKGNQGGYLLVKESEPDVRFIHMHIVCKDDSQWHHYIHFRDTLRQNKDIRERYANLKKQLVKQYSNDRAAYTMGKANFIKTVLRQKQ